MKLFKWEKDKTLNSVVSHKFKEAKNVKGRSSSWGKTEMEVLREKDLLLSKISLDPTVGNLRGKKESCSTRSGLRVGTRFKKFRKTSFW